MNVTAEQILSGNTRAVARAATAIENRTPGAQNLLRQIFHNTGRATVIGITGAPGAGKSTLVAQLAHALRGEGRQVGIIAVDPSSPYTGGALLGDRVRMQAHHADAGVFIRSMATRGALGGLAAATTDLAVLLDAAGKDTILIETVGVGQDEVEIASLADATVVVLVPGMGDDVQAIKAGILEIADIFVINKSDQPGADRLERELKFIQSLSTRRDGWVPPILWTVASEDKGIAEVLAAVRLYGEFSRDKKRGVAVWSSRLREMLRERLLDRFSQEDFESAARDVAERKTDPYSVIDGWLQRT